MADHNELGKLGEAFALSYFQSKSYILLESNWRFRKEEIDLIFQFNNQIVFVEVKTRTAAEHANAEDVISNAKIRHLIEAADQYLQLKNIQLEAQFDVLILVSQGTSFEVEHIPEAFSPSF